MDAAAQAGDLYTTPLFRDRNEAMSLMEEFGGLLIVFLPQHVF